VIKHESASVVFAEHQPLLVEAQTALKEFSDVMLMADRAFVSHDLMHWFRYHKGRELLELIPLF
jgi:hypothetical protein